MLTTLSPVEGREQYWRQQEQNERDYVQKRLADATEKANVISRGLFWVAVVSLFVSGGSLYVASLALWISCLPK
jgi:hypothetical protein